MCDRWESPAVEYVVPVKGRACLGLFSNAITVTVAMWTGKSVTCRSVKLGYVIRIQYVTF